MKKEKKAIPEIEIFNDHPDFAFQEDRYREVVLGFLRENPLKVKSLALIFVTDDYLRDLHRQYLDDDSYSDVMTFNLGDGPEVEGEIYISVDRARIQAAEYGVALEEEIARLIVHGLLHLQGYDDRTEAERQQMRKLEDRFLEKILSASRNR